MTHLKYSTWEIERFKLDKLNLLQDMQNFFYSEALTTQIDRHVVHSIQEIPNLDDVRSIEAGCRLGFEVLKRCNSQRLSCTYNIFLSSPRLVIDGFWLNGAENPSPPHVALRLSKSPIADPALPSYLISRHRSEIAFIDNCLTPFHILQYCPQQDEEGDDGWIISFKE